MDIDTQAVAEAVAKTGAVACVLNDLAGRAVNGRAGNTGLGGGDPCQLGLQYDIVDVPHLVTGSAQRHSAGHVAAIALIDAAEIHGDKVPLTHLSHTGYGVGHGAVGAGGHDGIKGGLFRTGGHHQIVEPGGNLLLRHAGADLLEDLLQRALGDPLGGGHAGQLLLVLAAPQLRHQR